LLIAEMFINKSTFLTLAIFAVILNYLIGVPNNILCKPNLVCVNQGESCWPVKQNSQVTGY